MLSSRWNGRCTAACCRTCRGAKLKVKRPLYRGIRGELPRAFWLPDEQGMVCATDTAFMSTSRNRRTPVSFMQGESNVLWTMLPEGQTDSGYHCGADISMLSQYVSEEEVLFPPCTMLTVKSEVKAESSETAAVVRGNRCKEGDKAFVNVQVFPTFI